MSEPHVAVTERRVTVAVNTGPATLRVKGEGDPLGPELGAVGVDNDDTAGIPVSGWTATDAHYDDDGNSDKLIGPLDPPTPQTGFWVLTQRGGSTKVRRAKSIDWGAFGTYRVSVVEDNSYSEQVDVKYDGDDAGVNPFFQVMPVAGKAVSDGTRISIHQAVAAPDTSDAEAEITAIKASQAHDEQRIAALEQGEDTGGLNAAQVRALVANALAAYVPVAESPNLLAMIVDQAHHTATFTGRDADGNATHHVIAFGGTGQSGLTSQAAVDAAMAFLAALPEFDWTPATRTLRFTGDLPGADSVTMAMLAQAVRDAINAKLDRPGVNRAVSANADVRRLKAFETALRQTSARSGDSPWTQNVSGAYVRLGFEWPEFHEGDDIIIRIAPDNGNPVTATFEAAALGALAASQSAQGSDDNGLVLHGGGQTYYVSKEHDGHALVASDTAGGYAVSYQLDRITIDVDEQVPDGSVGEDKLDDATRGKIDAASVTIEEVDEEIHRLSPNPNAVASKTVSPVRSGNGWNLPVNLAFTDGDTNYTLISMYIGGVGDPSALISPEGSRNALVGWDVDYNDGAVKLQIANAVRNADTAEHDSFRWEDDHGGRPRFDDPCTVEIVAPAKKGNFVPVTGTNGYALTKTDEGGTFDDKLDGSAIADASVGNDQLGDSAVQSDNIADDAVETRHIAPEAVTGPTIAEDVRLPDATRLDDGLSALTQDGGWTSGHAAPQAQRVETAPTAPRHGQRILMLADQTIDGWGVMKAGRFSTGPIGYAPAAEFTHPFGTLLRASDGRPISTDIVRRIYSGAAGHTELWTYLTTQVLSKLLVATLDENGAPSDFTSYNLVNVPDGGGQRTQQNRVTGNPTFEVGETYLVKLEGGAANNIFPDVVLEEPDEYDWGPGRWVNVTQQIKDWAVEGGDTPTLADMGIWGVGTRSAYNALSAGQSAPFNLFLLSG